MSSNNTNIDMAQVKQALVNALTSADAWKDLLPASTGDAILDFISTSSVFATYSFERGIQEAFLDSAILPSSIISTMRQQGVRVSRKLPASATVTLNKPADGSVINIPAYSVFLVNNNRYYNRETILFNSPDIEKTVVLYEGYAKTVYTQGTGAVFQTFVALEPNFVIADTDVNVLMGNTVVIPVVTDGLWHYRASVVDTPPTVTITPVHAVRDSTLKTGELELTFGSSFFGTLPAVGEDIQIQYCITKGALGNDSNFANQKVFVEGFPTITGLTDTSLVGGADEKDLNVYKRLGPAEFASFDRAVNEAEYDAVASSYPGIVDAQILGQRDLAPTRNEWMNLLRICLITSTPWTQTQKDDFETWYRRRTMGYMRFYWVEPVAKDYTISAIVYVDATADFTDVYNQVMSALEEFVKPKLDTLNKTVYKSEVYDTIKNANFNAIKYIKLTEPITDVVTYTQAPDVTFTEEGVGPFVSDEIITYQINVSNVVDLVEGRTLPQPFTYQVQGNLTNIRLTWPAVYEADNIHIYVTRGLDTGLLVTLPGTATTFLDVGSSPVPGPIPSVNNQHVFYPNNTSINISMAYATDRGTGVK